jgi:glutamine cyclotransferase
MPNVRPIGYRVERTRRSSTPENSPGTPTKITLMYFLRLSRTVSFVSLILLAPSAFAADGYRIIHTYPHDRQAYTQGLIFQEGHLYESTGLNGRSSLRMIDLQTGQVLQRAVVPNEYFAEGLAACWGLTQDGKSSKFAGPSGCAKDGDHCQVIILSMMNCGFGEGKRG